MISKSIFAAATIAAAGWGAHEYLGQTYAKQEAVEVAQATANFVLDRQAESLIARIAFLEAKKGKTATEWQELRYLRGQLERLRRVRTGK